MINQKILDALYCDGVGWTIVTLHVRNKSLS